MAIDDIFKAFKKKQGIKDTKVARMMSRKEAGNFTTIGSKVSNPFINPKFNVSAIGRDKHYYLIRQYENDIAKDLVKSITYVERNGIDLSPKQMANLEWNFDMLKNIRKANEKSEEILIKDGKNPLDVMATEQAKVKPSQLSSDLTEPAPDLFKDMEDLNKSMKDLDDAAKDIEKSGLGLKEDIDRINKLADDLKKSADDPFGEIGKAERKEKLKWMNYGKGFWKNEPYNRALSRKLLLHLDKNGILKLTDKVRDSLKNYDDLRGVPDELQVPDPIRVLREHIKPAHSSDHDTIFDILPQGLDEFSASQPGVFKELVKKLKDDTKSWRTGPDDTWVKEKKWEIKPTIGEAEEYFNPTEFQNRINWEKDTIKMLKEEGRSNKAIKIAEDKIKKLEEARIRVYPEYGGKFPRPDPRNTNFIMTGIDESWGPHGGDINRIGRYTTKTKVDPETGESTSVSWDTFDEKKGKFYDKESDWKFNNAYKNNEEVDLDVIESKFFDDSGKMKQEGKDIVKEGLAGLGKKAKKDKFKVIESTPDERHRAMLKNKLMQLPDFKNTSMTPEDLDFTLQDVKAGDDMNVAWEKVKVRAKELDKKKEQDQMNKNMAEAFEGLPQSGTIDDLKAWAKKKGVNLGDDVPKKQRLNIRLMQNFDQELDDITLGKEGYNLQEIGILKRAREVMKSGDADHPDEAMQWVRGEMADEAGVDIDEFMVEFDWGDAGKKDYATGGLVGLQNDLINQYDLY